MYTDSFKLNEPPFSLTPDPRFLYMSEQHREGLAHLLYGVQQPGGFVQLTGDIGSGKTTLCRCLIQQLPPETDIALILNPRLTVPELLATVFDELGIPQPAENASVKTFIDALNRYLLSSHAQHRKTVLLIDEAQNLSNDVLEQIRLLTNLETSREKLLQIILIGQPELLSMLKRKELQQVAQRITARYHLRALSRSDTYAYIKHRLAVAGRRDPLFTRSAAHKIYRLSGGMPRLINIICDRALLGAYAKDKQMVSAAIVTRAGLETQGVVPWYKRLRPGWAALAITLLALLAGIAVFFASSYQSMNFQGESLKPAASTNVAAAAVKIEPPGATSPLEDIKPPEIKPEAEIKPAMNSSGQSSALASILANPSLDGEAGASFNNLFASWGTRISMGPSDLGCKVGRANGYECLFQGGGWPKLRRLNLPAILEVSLPNNGQRRHVTLVGLDNDKAKVAIGNKEYIFSISEIDKLWDGSFILLWKPPFAFRQLYPGMKGEDVKWIRSAMDKLDGNTAVSNASDRFDKELQLRIKKFQKEQSLDPDGVIGIETLVRLIRIVGETEIPSIVQHTSLGA
jgi:general secretion pathway protein A